MHSVLATSTTNGTRRVQNSKMSEFRTVVSQPSSRHASTQFSAAIEHARKVSLCNITLDNFHKLSSIIMADCTSSYAECGKIILNIRIKARRI